MRWLHTIGIYRAQELKGNACGVKNSKYYDTHLEGNVDNKMWAFPAISRTVRWRTYICCVNNGLTQCRLQSANDTRKKKTSSQCTLSNAEAYTRRWPSHAFGPSMDRRTHFNGNEITIKNDSENVLPPPPFFRMARPHLRSLKCPKQRESRNRK